MLRRPHPHALFRGFQARQYHVSPISMDKKLFDKILVANRGEIACRVMRTAKRLGIKTVAVHSEPDATAKHVAMADEAVCLGPAASSKSYLSIPAILDAIKKTGAQAVHPGYGFLSENANFAQTLEDNGIVFIGPGSAAIRAMGDKIESKKLAKAAGVSVIPGFLGEVDTDEEVLKIAHEIGYPVMIKASAGGGGKGMRIAWNDQEALTGFRMSKSEAKSSFGDDRMLIEKYIDNPRHIEIQVMADGQGKALYFLERECSIQRRNQKVIEEAPSPLLSEATRHAMGRQAVALARAVNYRSAGTVEFLADQKQNFYFLEMNTRLQVEHPVTEYITGYDLVELMIRVAAGEKLDIQQENIVPKGWAMECRVYAEDPLRNFLPSIGRLSRYQEPSATDGSVRVDGGVVEGSNISMYYDPLISKLVTYGPDRQGAILRMARALDRYVIRGVNHNIPFLRSVMDHPRFIAGELSTKFIADEFPEGFKGHQLKANQEEELVAIAAIIQHTRKERARTIEGQLPGAEERLESLGEEDGHYVVTVDGKDTEVYVSDDNEEEEGEEEGPPQDFDKIAYTVVFPETQKSVVLKHDWLNGDVLFNAQFGKRKVVVQVVAPTPLGLKLQHYGTQYDVLVRSPAQKDLSAYISLKKAEDTSSALRSPMPGLVLSVAVKPGDAVVAGQELAVVEAMKMQNILRAEKNGVVSAVLATPGASVAVDDVLVEFAK